MTHLTRNLRRKYWPTAACFVATTLFGSCAARDSPAGWQEQADGDDDSTSTDEVDSADREPSTPKDLSPSNGDAGAAAGVASCPSATEGAFALFSTRCVSCHGGDGKNQGGFGAVLSASVMIASGRVVPGQPSSSSVYRRVQSGDMPRDGTRLSSAELVTIERWIECGAPELEAPVVDQGPAVVDAGVGDVEGDDDEDEEEEDDDDEDVDDEAEEAQEDLDDQAEEAQEDLDDQAEEAQEDLDEQAEEAAEDDD